MVTRQTVLLADVLNNEKFMYHGHWHYWFHVITEKHIVMAVPIEGGSVTLLHIDTVVEVERPVIITETRPVKKSIKDVIKSIIKDSK